MGMCPAIMVLLGLNFSDAAAFVVGNFLVIYQSVGIFSSRSVVPASFVLAFMPSVQIKKEASGFCT